ncbi:DUF6776 family protein [Methylibium sp.]|uniref:DUF6776 family protein n=1 Tax=Methylibium sp. TaxID=2067992 RepID=UPI003D0DEE0B
MRWKLLRRRLSISAPRMIVRSHLPWPMRWAVLALALGFSAALALWAFEFGRDIAGLDRLDRVQSPTPVASDATDLEQLRSERDKAQSIANTAESLLKTERTTQERLVGQIKALEAENMVLKGDLGFFERLLPTSGKAELVVRGLQAEVVGSGQLRYQLLVMQQGKAPTEFKGRYELTLRGQLGGQSWSQQPSGAQRSLQFRQYQRVDGMLEFPALVVVDALQVRVLDAQGGVRASQDVSL